MINSRLGYLSLFFFFFFCLLLLLLPRPAMPLNNWERLRVYARDQFTTEVQVDRSAQSNKTYDEYKKWCQSRGLSNAEYVRRHVHWDERTGLGFEPNLAPLHFPEEPKEPAGGAIMQYVLWHRSVPGDTVLDMAEELELVHIILGIDVKGSDRLAPGRDVILFQNDARIRSVPEIVHAHVFFRVAMLSERLHQALSERHRRWLARSPYLAERAKRSSL